MKSDHWSEYRNIWQMSFLETLLLRLGYVLFYSLLLFYEAFSLVRWMISMPRPPVSMVVASLVLVIGWSAYRT